MRWRRKRREGQGGGGGITGREIERKRGKEQSGEACIQVYAHSRSTERVFLPFRGGNRVCSREDCLLVARPAPETSPAVAPAPSSRSRRHRDPPASAPLRRTPDRDATPLSPRSISFFSTQSRTLVSSSWSGAARVRKIYWSFDVSLWQPSRNVKR